MGLVHKSGLDKLWRLVANSFSKRISAAKAIKTYIHLNSLKINELYDSVLGLLFGLHPWNQVIWGIYNASVCVCLWEVSEFGVW